jgi:hypothetical protein
MTASEFSDQFDVLYNNITSNQAPGLTEYEKAVFLTKAQDEKLKNYFSANSQGNTLQQGFDGSQKRQIDFSALMKTSTPSVTAGAGNFDARTNGVAKTSLPDDVWIIVNEKVTVSRGVLTVKPISFAEYDLLMSKPFKRPLKYQAWRLISNTSNSADLIAGPSDTISGYSVRYVRRPKPILVGDMDGLTINNYEYGTTHSEPSGSTPGTWDGCELDPILHEEILQRAVELAKIAWTATGQDNAQMVIQAGQRSE